MRKNRAQCVVRLVITIAVALISSACVERTATQQLIQTPSVDQNITPTALPSVTAAPTVTASPTTTTVAVQLAKQPTSIPMATPDQFMDKLPRDARGRIIGGPYAPVINYSPTMITGKPCPR